MFCGLFLDLLESRLNQDKINKQKARFKIHIRPASKFFSPLKPPSLGMIFHPTLTLYFKFAMRFL
jgi:hypothetical protein